MTLSSSDLSTKIDFSTDEFLLDKKVAAISGKPQSLWRQSRSSRHTPNLTLEVLSHRYLFSKKGTSDRCVVFSVEA